jgi:hypothetical protein
VLPGSRVPEINSLLGQAERQLVIVNRTGAAPDVGNVIEFDLSFGRPFVVRTRTPEDARPEPFVRINIP